MIHHTTFLLCALTLFSNVVHASFDVRSACQVDTYGPFKLYSVSDGPDGTSLINVVKIGVDNNNDTISTLTTCDTCGQTPLYWTLKNSVLSPIFNVTGPSSVETINLDLSFGKVNVITGPERNLTPAPNYCAELDTALPAVLSANGHTTLFSVCSWVGGIGPAHRRDVYYNQTSTGVASNCQNTTLVIKDV